MNCTLAICMPFPTHLQLFRLGCMHAISHSFPIPPFEGTPHFPYHLAPLPFYVALLPFYITFYIALFPLISFLCRRNLSRAFVLSS